MITIPLRQAITGCNHPLSAYKPVYYWNLHSPWPKWSYSYHRCTKCGYRVKATNSSEWEIAHKPVSQIGTRLPPRHQFPTERDEE